MTTPLYFQKLWRRGLSEMNSTDHMNIIFFKVVLRVVFLLYFKTYVFCLFSMPSKIPTILMMNQNILINTTESELCLDNLLFMVFTKPFFDLCEFDVFFLTDPSQLSFSATKKKCKIRFSLGHVVGRF